MASKDLQRIRQAVLLGNLKFTNHAIEEMDEEDFEVLDVESAIMTGKIVQKQKHQLNFKYRISGKDTSHDIVTVVGRFTKSGYFLIITAFSGE